MLFKQVKIENFQSIQSILQKKIADQILNRRDAIAISFNELKDSTPELINWLDMHKLKLDVARFLITPPLSTLGIHIDGSFPDYPKFFALNLPIFNCNNSHMIWWDNVFVKEEIQFNEYGGKIKIFDSNSKTVLAKLELTSPHFVKIDSPHSVDNSQNNKIRVVLSLRFNPEPIELFNLL